MFLTILTGILSTLIAITALVGNGFICLTVKRNQKLHTATFVLIVGQCISDMMFGVCLMTCLVFCSDWFINRLGNGTNICSLSGTIFTASYTISSLTMTTLAVERYMLIFYPLKPKMSLRQAWSLNAFIYVFGHFLAYSSQLGYSYRIMFGKVEYQI